MALKQPLPGWRVPGQLVQRIGHLFLSKLARAAWWLFAGSFLGGVLGYVFQVLMGRMLTTREFALFSAVMAFFAISAAALSTLMMVVSREVAGLRADADLPGVRALYSAVLRKAAPLCAGMLVVWWLLTEVIQDYLQAPTRIPVYVLGALLVANCFLVVNQGFLQGLQQFRWLSASGLACALLKIALGTALVWLGLGVDGALLGTLVAFVLTCLIAYGPIPGQLPAAPLKPSRSGRVSFRSATPVLMANAAFALMTQFDVLLVNYYFSAEQAGVYAAAAVLGKAVMYLPGGIALALFPMVAENHARNKGSAHLLFQAVGLVAALCGIGALFYLSFGEQIVLLLFGEKYSGGGEVLRLYGFAMLPMALVYVAEHFLIAKGRVLFAYLFIVSAPLQLAALYVWHDSLRTVVAVIGVSGMLLALVGFGILWRSYRKT